ncbi:hypothetical protein [Leptospira santarosai]|uniref:hypothetical protein n=1 Tax=Leptospira santarosai TaxID=28183 RepID=UPI0002FE65A0|nr:hypothetical protein [Leptospira santarosai]
MNKNERREYIAEKIFEAKKKLVVRTYLVGKEEHKYNWIFPSGKIVDSKTDFEFLPEWVGPICEVVLPMLEANDLCIVPFGCGIGIFRTEAKWIDGPFVWSGSKDLSIALVDAHIKIEKEKKQQRA